MRGIIGLFAIVVITGCADVDRLGQTDFKPTDTGFEFQGIADAIRTNDDPDAEAWRMGQINAYLSDNAICPNGFRITDRREVLVLTGALGSIYDIYYTGECA